MQTQGHTTTTKGKEVISRKVYVVVTSGGGREL